MSTDAITNNVRAAMDAVGDQPAEVKAAVGAAAASAAVPAPTSDQAGPLWKTLVTGLVVILIISLVGIIWTVADGKDTTSPDVIVTVFTAALTGLLGLFVKPAT